MVDRDAWVLGPPLAQVLTARIDKTGAVLWDAEHPPGPVGSGEFWSREHSETPF